MHLARLLVGVGARWEIWCSRAIVIYFSFADAYLSVAPNLSNTAAAGVWIELNGAFFDVFCVGIFFFHHRPEQNKQKSALCVPVCLFREETKRSKNIANLTASLACVLCVLAPSN